MKAALALIVIYLGMFLVAIQGSAPSAVQAAAQNALKQNPPGTAAQVDPVKEADIRAFIELIGARDQIQDSVTFTAEQYREKLLATVPHNETGQAFVNTVISEYQKKYDVDLVTDQLVLLYDKHYTDEDIKGLLQFYGTPLGQKVAREQPRIGREIQEATRAAASKTVRDALQQAKQENPGIGQNAHLSSAAPHRPAQQRRTPQPASSPEAAGQDQP